MASDRCGGLAKEPTQLEVVDCQRVTIERLRAVVAAQARVIAASDMVFGPHENAFGLQAACGEYDAVRAELAKLEG